MLTLLLAGLLALQPEPAPATASDTLRAEAVKIRALVESPLARELLDATEKIRDAPTRVVWMKRDRSAAATPAQYDAMTPAQREGLERREISPSVYINSGYGSPLIYARVLDVAHRHGVTSLNSLRVMDFGCGTIGHIQLMAHAGAAAHGVDVDPVLAAIYSDPTDTGPMGPGRADLTIDRWPASEGVIAKVGGQYDLITAKNTLKAGYIHPKPPQGQTVNPRHVISLGVSDDIFLKNLRQALKPSGLLVIYNISPAQNPPEKPYIPWADGNSPWSREELTAAGFEVLEHDTDDNAKLFPIFAALGYDQGKGVEGMKGSYFTHVTVVRRKEKP